MCHSLEDTTIFITVDLLDDIINLINECYIKNNVVNNFENDFKSYNKKSFKEIFISNEQTNYIRHYFNTIETKQRYLNLLLSCVSFSFPWYGTKTGFRQYDNINDCFQNSLKNIYDEVMLKIKDGLN